MGYSLLIVDDSSIIRKSLTKALSLSGLEIERVLEAANGREALELVGRERVDLIFLDINMPEMNGVEFLRAVRARENLCGIPVLVISTEGSKLRFAELEALGIQGILRKPVRPEALAETVGKLLSGGTDGTR